MVLLLDKQPKTITFPFITILLIFNIRKFFNSKNYFFVSLLAKRSIARLLTAKVGGKCPTEVT